MSKMETLQFHFKDDGMIPNSPLPLIIYKQAFEGGDALADTMEQKFAANNWVNSWRNGIFTYHHYHCITHEVVGVYSGYAELHMGGESGERIKVQAGDVIVIPAGTGHKKVSASNDFRVIGAYPDGMEYDLMTGEEGERPRADERIANVPLPETDPVSGKEGGITKLWTLW
jgi:uncharacterized protein YjlB